MDINKKIHQLRSARGLTLEKLSQMANMTKGNLSKIERARRAPPVSTLQALAVALGVDISDFFEETATHHSHTDSLDIARKADGGKDGTEQIVSQEGYSYRPLVKDFKNKYMSPFMMTIEKGETGAFSHDSEELDYVAAGTIVFEYQGERHVLREGDSFYYDSRKPHRFINEQDQPAIVICINFNYRRF